MKYINIFLICMVLLIPTCFKNCITPLENPERCYFSPDEKRVLEQLGQGECSYCSVEEIMAVMSVAINRRDHPDYPNTLWSVVHQKNAFPGYFRKDYDKNGNKIINPNVYIAMDSLTYIYTSIDKDVLGYFREEHATNTKWVKYVKSNYLITDTFKYHQFHTL